jgi:hypothetical protein
VFRLDLGIDTGDRQARLPTAPPVKAPPRVVDPSPREPRKKAASPLAWALFALLATGVAALGVGFGSLAWATVHSSDMVWHWGMTATIAGEAALILGLTAMAIRLWQNSRRLNSQLDGVDQQLAEVQYTAGRLAHARQSCSQAYYDHFGAAASPPIALANLRGQLDQLSARLSR